jgi:translation initiation factor IF-2
MATKGRQTSRTKASKAAPEAASEAAPEAKAAEEQPQGDGSRTLQIPRALTVKELGDLMDISPVEVIKELMKNGVMATINQTIDFDTAAIVAHDFGFEPEEAPVAETVETAPGGVTYQRFHEDDTSVQEPRPPVVTIMGHVDHGKTSLLDIIRETSVVAGEAGGITQHIGAYQVETDGHRITFLDTPGHEAFTAMRARGAQVTDIAILVVAANDGVMPQTIEAIDHAKAAGVPIIVAINKIDLAEANPDRVKQQLSERGLVIEEWGGDVICVPVSAKTKEGISDLLASTLVQAEVLELKANPARPAVGAIVEAELDSTRGALATVLVQTGTLKQGDAVVVGDTWGKIKAMFNEHGKRQKTAGPGVPVKVLGLQDVPRAGDTLTVVEDDRKARQIIQQKQREREALEAREVRPVSLDSIFGQMTAGKVKDLNIILKTDVQGSIDPIRTSLERLSTDQTRVNIVHSGSGTITESDIMLALASQGIIIGFNTRPEPGARLVAESEGVDVRHYEVIYNLVEDVEKALKGLLEPVYREVEEGEVEVRQVFRISRRGNIAGCYVRDGVARRGALVRVLRGEDELANTSIESLRRFQDDVREVQSGYECGIALADFDDFQEGDIFRLYRRERETP